jgi:hypothetical protein
MNYLTGYASSLTNQVKWHGDHKENDSQNILRAGCLSMIYENGDLRQISIKNTEVLQKIYSAVRDKNWLTLKPLISEELINIRKDSFTIGYKCHYLSDEINFAAEYLIEGRSDNSISFSFKGEALDVSVKNRIGFCVLHPIRNVTGTECTIIHSNDEIEKLKFPVAISPHQPFRDISSMQWVTKGYKSKLDFYGDVFETEDQRNWTDASFKTYCTPLNLPFPMKLEKGDTISQRIEFKVEVEVEVDVKEKDNSSILITVYPEKRTRIPALGIGRSTRPEPLNDPEINILRELRFDHYRVDLYLFLPCWIDDAKIAVAESKKLKYPLEFALFLNDDFEDQTAKFIFWIKNNKADTKLISLYHTSYKTTPDSIINKISFLLRNAIPGVKLGCGTNSNFAQLNRNRPGSDLFDNLTFSIHPQEHASDNLSLVENLQAQGATVESAELFSKGKGIWVSPVNIQRRFNANKENYEQTLNYSGFPAQVDSRLMSLLGASWTAASIKYLSEAGTEGITYFETVGERGIFQGDFPSRWPEDFKTAKGMIFPVFHLCRFVLDSKEFEVLASQSSDPLSIDILALSQGKKLKMVLMNFTGEAKSIRLKDISGEFSIKHLHAGNYAEAVSDSNWLMNLTAALTDVNENILLEPFSLNFVEGKVHIRI